MENFNQINNSGVLAPERPIRILPDLNPFGDLERDLGFRFMFGFKPVTENNKEEPKFQVVQQKYDRHVVIPDLHGENTLLERVIDLYQREDIGFVFLGDLIDRKGPVIDKNSVPKLLDTISALGKRAIITLANHELILLGALTSEDQIRAYAYSYYYNIIKANTLKDYGIIEDTFDWAKEDLKSIMKSLGHLSLLESSTPYYETDDFIATHAGINHSTPWEIEKEKLDKLSTSLSKGEFPDPYPKNGVQMEEGLEPIFSFKNAMDSSPITSTDKIIVSGHAHSLGNRRFNDTAKKNKNDRIILNGQRVRLASQLNKPKNDDLFIWQDWDNEIKVISNFR